MTSALETVLNRIELSARAETAFKALNTLIREGKQSIEEKQDLLNIFYNEYHEYAWYIRQLKEAYQHVSLLAAFPQFDITTPVSWHSGRAFFMEDYGTVYTESLNQYTKSARYTDASTGIAYYLQGHAWEYEGRIHTQAFIDAETVSLNSYPLNETVNGMRYTSSQQLVDMAFSTAETALFAKLQLIPF